MPSDETVDVNAGQVGSKVRKGSKKQKTFSPRACDFCRRKKIKCDSTFKPGIQCSNCVTQNCECTFMEDSTQRAPSKKYVLSLEDKLETMEKLLRHLLPDEAVFNELMTAAKNGDLDRPSSSMTFPTQDVISSDTIESVTSAIRIATHPTNSPPRVADDEDDANLLIDNIRRVTLNTPTHDRFLGKSSAAMLVSKVMELKYACAGTGPPHAYQKRNAFWTPRPWEQIDSPVLTTVYSFPEPDLAAELIALYFSYANRYIPLLHRPTFERSIREGLHFENDGFARVFLLVCAIGARRSEDPRVLLDGVDPGHVQYSCGWKWFMQVQLVKKSLLLPPSLYDIQFYCLVVQYLSCTTLAHSCWTLLGIGIRSAQEVGAHRRKVHGGLPTAEEELWKRAFWTLVFMDRLIGSKLGRPCAIQDEDFDLDFPLECDDEFWEDGFKQPPDKPSSVTYFVSFLKLLKIIAICLRTVYAVDKTQTLVGHVGPKWDEHVVVELDSALNLWFDSVANHLRWDPRIEDDTFFNQSVSLHALYYNAQILIHRPFIPSANRPSSMSFPSLAICTNAARACTHLVDIQFRRNGFPNPQIQNSAFTAAVVLLLNIWGGKRSGILVNPGKELADVRKCMDVLKILERRFNVAGQLWDMLNELASMGDLHLHDGAPSPSNKRGWDCETSISPSSSEALPTAGHANDLRNVAGSKRIIKDSQLFPEDVSYRLAVPQSTHRQSSSVLLGFTPQQRPSTSLEQDGISLHRNENYSLPLAFSETLDPDSPSQTQTLSSTPNDFWGDLTTNNWSSAANSLYSMPGYESAIPAVDFPLSEMTLVGNGTLPCDTMQYNLAASKPPSSFANGTGEMDALDDPSSFPMDLAFDPKFPVTSDRGGLESLNHGYPNPLESAYTTQMANGKDTNDYDEAINMWLNAPMGFELDEWDTYLSNFNELTNNVQQVQ